MDENKLTIQVYYECMGDKIKEPLLNILYKNIVFKSKWANYKSREEMLDAVWPYVGINKAYNLEIKKIKDYYLVSYDLKNKKDKNKIAEAIEKITFNDKKMIEIEVKRMNKI